MPTFSPILQVITLLSWAVFSATVFKPSAYTHHFGTFTPFESACTLLNLKFAPGLLSMFRSATPPTVDWLKSLPTFVKSSQVVWAIYLCVLQKPGCRDKVYIGSATEAGTGLQRRFTEYEGPSATIYMGRYMKAAVKDGYVITAKGVMCWCPIPSAGIQPKMRTLFHVLEALFTFALWTLHTPNGGDFCLGHMSL